MTKKKKKKTVKKKASLTRLTSGKKKTARILVSFLLDRSGSMASCQEETISGFNQYISKLKADKNEYLFSLTTFDTEAIDNINIKTPIEHVAKLNKETYVPRSGTPLYDAIAQTIEKMDDEKNVLFVIMTDGEENSSKKFNREQICDLIRCKEKHQGWTFAYLGSNQDSWKVASAIGLQRGNTINYCSTPEGTKKAYKLMGESTIAFACAVGRGVSQTDNLFNGETEVK